MKKKIEQIRNRVDEKSTFECPECECEVPEDTEYCVNCEKKVSMDEMISEADDFSRSRETIQNGLDRLNNAVEDFEEPQGVIRGLGIILDSSVTILRNINRAESMEGASQEALGLADEARDDLSKAVNKITKALEVFGR